MTLGGQTTTLTSLAGIIIPTSGTVRIGGHDIARDGVKAKSQLAFIPDEPHLFDYLTVEEHLRFVGRLYGVADAAERIPPLLQARLDGLDLHCGCRLQQGVASAPSPNVRSMWDPTSRITAAAWPRRWDAGQVATAST